MLFLAFSFHFVSKHSIQNSSAPPSADTSAVIEQKQAKPLRLKIPKLNVDAAIEHVGLTSEGDMDIPKDPANAAWFNLGPHPGKKGSAVIAGHFGWRNNIPAVFDNLHKLQKGDIVHVEDEKGLVTTFVVRESRTYGPDDYAPAVFVSTDGKVHLNLITCTGDWNKAQKSYSTRLVVFADKQ